MTAKPKRLKAREWVYFILPFRMMFAVCDNCGTGNALRFREVPPSLPKRRPKK